MVMALLLLGRAVAVKTANCFQGRQCLKLLVITLLLSAETRFETVGAASGKKEQSWENVPVNSAKFIEGGEEAVPEHERYLYRY